VPGSGWVDLVRRVWRDERRLAFYEWDFADQPPGERDEAAFELMPETWLPPALKARLFPGANPVSTWLMHRRARQRRIRFFGLVIDGELAAFAGIRAWSIERRECAWLRRPGPLLGPAWTDPKHRGKGLHRRLLLHRLHVCKNAAADVAYTSAFVYNTASRRNIERAGFRARGCVVIRRAWFRLVVDVRPLPDEPRAVLGEAERRR
jgi:RimJ/RimL family protein N-acetyltransferase